MRVKEGPPAQVKGCYSDGGSCSPPPTAVQHERGPRKSKNKEGGLGGLSMGPTGDHYPTQDATKLPPLLFPPPPMPSLKPHAPHMFPEGILAPTPIFMPHVPTSQPHGLLHMLSSAEKLQVRFLLGDLSGSLAKFKNHIRNLDSIPSLLENILHTTMMIAKQMDK